MISKMWGVGALAVTLAMAASGVQAQVKTGEAAPPFSLKDTKGKTHQLADFKGKFVVLEWVNLGCPFVKKHYNSGNMQALQEKYTAAGVIWLSVNSAAPGMQGNFDAAGWNSEIATKGIKSTAVLLDGDRTVGKSYGAITTPQMFVINPEGVLIYQGAIDDQPTTDPDTIKGAKNYVAAALDEAMAGQPVTVGTTKPYGCHVRYK